MIAVIFEVWPKPEHKQEYLDLAAGLRPILRTIDGFISVERFESLTEKGKILSLSFFRDEAAVEAWRNVAAASQGAGQGPRQDLRELPAAHRRRDPRLRHERARAGAEGQSRRSQRELAPPRDAQIASHDQQQREV